jgi:CheY-like chemotaxis protein
MVRFLVVDDDHATVRGMTALLTGDGHEVVPHTTGAAAVEALSLHSFDAVVTDLEMPHVDGHAVVRHARERVPHACLVVVSAKAAEKVNSLVEAGACMVADKPIDYERVTKTITDCRARGTCDMRSADPSARLLAVRR